MTTATEKLVGAYARLSKEEREAFLAQIADVDTQIVAYTISGKPLNRQEYINEIQFAIDEAKRGETISHDELLAEISQWRNTI